MKRCSVLLSILVTLGLCLTIVIWCFPAAATQGATARYIVHFKAGTAGAETESVHSRCGGVLERAIPQLRAHIIKVPPAVVENRLAAYRLQASVESIEPDYEVRVAAIPSDPDYPQQWGLARIQAPQAWDITRGSRAVPIAIVDIGIDTSHPDLAGKIISSRNLTSSDTYNDRFGHGTHVAGIAAAATSNGAGVAGVGYDCSLMNVKVLGDNGSGYYSDIANGIVWAADNGARVINLSIGGSVDSQTLKDAVDYAWNKGAVVVVAEGNGGSSVPNYPAYYEHAIAVAAVDSSDRLYSFSNRGSWVDVMAPGSAYSTLPGGSYGTMSGTSMASPHVAGLAGLAFSIARDANSDGRLNDEVRDLIQNNCDRIPTDGTGSGRINAYRTVSAAKLSSGVITGKVTGAANGRPVSGATVSTGSRYATTSSTGVYSFADLPAGAYTLTASASGYLPSSPRTVSLAAGQTVNADFALVPDIHLAQVTGTVFDAATLLPLPGATLSDGSHSAVTSTRGTYSLAGLPAGTYTLRASAPGYTASNPRTVILAAGQSVSANFALIANGRILGTVTDAATGQPLGGATVSDGSRSVITDAYPQETERRGLICPGMIFHMPRSPGGREVSILAPATSVQAWMTGMVSHLPNHCAEEQPNQIITRARTPIRPASFLRRNDFLMQSLVKR